MTQKDYENKIEELQQQIQKLQKTNLELVNHNLQLSKQINAFYDVRRRVHMLKELVKRHQDLLRHADLRDDDELMALIEIRLEESHVYENPDFGLKELADLMGTTQTRLNELFRRSPIHKTVDDYLDYLRLLRSMYYLQTELSWGIAACAQEAGFSVVRTYNRKFQDALGMTPHEFRMLIEECAEQVKEVTGKI
jgi:transcriptional regulator GlxA family with amidase domain